MSQDTENDLDTLNRFMVGAHNNRIVILNLCSCNRPVSLSHDEALGMAAWLVALTGEREKFLELLAAVENT